MTGFVQTLWDLLPAKLRAHRPGVKPVAPKPARAGATTVQSRVRRAKTSRGVQDVYDGVVAEMLARYGVRVRKWRSGMSGVAWELIYHDGKVKRLIEAPRPKGPMSMAIFLHEIGHHAIGFNVYKPRCLEEYHAWAFALRVMEEKGLNITEAVRRRVQRSLRYAGEKAVRRGIKKLPDEIAGYMRRAGDTGQ